MICLSLTGSTLEENVDLIRRYRDFIDVAELRVDLLAPHEPEHVPEFPELVRSAGFEMPLILTARRIGEGGFYSRSEHDRISVLQECEGFDFVDLDEDLRDTVGGIHAESVIRRKGSRIIRSVHDVGPLSERLAERIRELAAEEGEIARIAVNLRSTADIARLLTAADATCDVEKILVALGAFAVPPRILYRRFGSLITYVADPDSPLATPGQLAPDTLGSLYRANSTTDETKYFAVIGLPVLHSKSPQYHNKRFIDDGIDARYVPIRVDNVDAFMDLAERLPLQGFSITIPHKESCVRIATEMDEATRLAGSCNTLVRNPNGWSAINTDVPGIADPLGSVFPEASGRGATVIGAGGAARAAALALVRMGMNVLVLNRSPERANQLVSDLRALVGLSEDRLVSGALTGETSTEDYRDVIIQCTSVGMHGDGDPVPWMEFEGTEIVFDVVYTPPETPLIVRARKAGCITITGEQMFEAQANAQYELFNRRDVS